MAGGGENLRKRDGGDRRRGHHPARRGEGRGSVSQGRDGGGCEAVAEQAAKPLPGIFPEQESEIVDVTHPAPCSPARKLSSLSAPGVSAVGQMRPQETENA